MTVAALTPSVSYLENGVSLAFAVPFRFNDPTHLVVKRIAADGTVTALAYGSAWSATGGTTDAGGTVTLIATTAGATLTIDRATPRAQTTDYDTNDRFPAESHEAAVDRAMMVSQEQDVLLADHAARALMVPRGETAPLMPSIEDRADKALFFDAAGVPAPQSLDEFSASSRAWAEGTLPGGAGTKSAKEWAGEADGHADRSEAARDVSIASSVQYPSAAEAVVGLADGAFGSYLDGSGNPVWGQRVGASMVALPGPWIGADKIGVAGGTLADAINYVTPQMFGALGNGVANDTAALLAFFNHCVAENVAGHIPAGTYIITLGQLLLDNGHVNTPFPCITTDGASLVKFKAAANINSFFLKISNGTPTSALGQFWQGGFLGGIAFEPAPGSVAGLTAMHGLVLRGIEDADFGFFEGLGLGGNTVHLERNLFGGNNPDPAHVNRCRFLGSTARAGNGYAFYNDNYRGFAFSKVGNIFANGCVGGALFGLGASNEFTHIGAAFCQGWTVGDQSNSTGGASNSVRVSLVEIDSTRNGIDMQNCSEAFTCDSVKIIHRFNAGPNATLMQGYWPRIGLRVGSSFRSVRDIYFNSVEDRIEPGGTLSDLGALADFVNAGGNLAQVYISRNVSDNAGIGITSANFFSNFNSNSFNVYYRRRRSDVIDTRRSGAYLRARNSGAVAIPNTGFGTPSAWVAYDTLIGGNADNFNATTYEYTTPTSCHYRIRATLALVLPAGRQVRLGIYINGSLAHSSFQYSTTAAAQTYAIEFTAFVPIGQIIKINADQNSTGPVATGGTTGGVNDSYFSVEQI